MNENSQAATFGFRRDTFSFWHFHPFSYIPYHTQQTTQMQCCSYPQTPSGKEIPLQFRHITLSPVKTSRIIPRAPSTRQPLPLRLVSLILLLLRWRRHARAARDTRRRRTRLRRRRGLPLLLPRRRWTGGAPALLRAVHRGRRLEGLRALAGGQGVPVARGRHLLGLDGVRSWCLLLGRRDVGVVASLLLLRRHLLR